ncbi:MAG: sugar phosphate isomerase/epimerase family protein [Christensenellales bacterium]
MRVGLSTASFFTKLDIKTSVETVAKMGYDLCEVFLGTYSEYKKEFILELKEQCVKHHVSIYSVHALGTQFEPQLFSPSEAQRQDAFRVFQMLVDASTVLGATGYVFHGGLNLKRTLSGKPNLERIAPIADQLATVCQDHGIAFMWENVHWCTYSYPEFAKELLQLCKSDNLYFTLDIKQAAQSGRTAVEYLPYMGSRLKNVHICDYTKNEGSIITMLPFEGTFDFVELKQSLKEIDYDGPVFVEVYADNFKTVEELTQSCDKVRRLFV